MRKYVLMTIFLVSAIWLSGCTSPFLNKSRLIVLKPEGEINVKDLMSGNIGNFKGVALVATFPANKDGSITVNSDTINMSVGKTYAPKGIEYIEPTLAPEPQENIPVEDITQ